MMEHYLTTPLNDDLIASLKAGDRIYLSGILYTARDAAHKRFIELLDQGAELPFDPQGQVIYYVGPTPAVPGQVIGSAGPTSAYRMDAFAPALLDLGLKGMIGKGRRSESVIASMIKNKAVYFGAVGGLAVVLAKSIKKAEIIAFEDLGTEAVRRLTVEKMPLTVIVDSWGTNLYEEGPRQYLAQIKQQNKSAPFNLTDIQE